jgi:hypothetical protein
LDFDGLFETTKVTEDELEIWRIILEWILEKYGGKLYTRFICLRIGTSGGLL